jgi:hypothetical protein
MSNYDVKILSVTEYNYNFADMNKRMESYIKDYLSKGWTLQGGLALTMYHNNYMMMSQLVIKVIDNISDISDPIKC